MDGVAALPMFTALFVWKLLPFKRVLQSPTPFKQHPEHDVSLKLGAEEGNQTQVLEQDQENASPGEADDAYVYEEGGEEDEGPSTKRHKQ